jgi:DNA-binding CsgD family transcriptional regulator
MCGIALEFVILLSGRHAVSGRRERNDMDPETMTLSEWEKKVVDFVSVGLTDDEIATRLEVSKHTVLNCIALLLAKLRAKHRIEIVLHAYSNRANFLGTNNEATASLAVEDVLLVGRPIHVPKRVPQGA